MPSLAMTSVLAWTLANAASPAPSAVPAAASNAVPTAPVASTTGADERPLCTRERRTGTAFVKRVCRTRSERDVERREAREQMQSSQGIQTWNPDLDG